MHAAAATVMGTFSRRLMRICESAVGMLQRVAGSEVRACGMCSCSYPPATAMREASPRALVVPRRQLHCLPSAGGYL